MDSTQHKPGLDYALLGHSRSTVLVASTLNEGIHHRDLPPITVSVEHGAFRYVDYLTVQDADVLADALREVAQAARHAGCESAS